MSMEILLSILGVTSTDAKDVWRLLFESNGESLTSL